MTIRTEFTRPLSGLSQHDLMLAGGKAAALGEMIGKGFPVPDGFCLTTGAYRAFVRENGLEAEILSAAQAGRSGDIHHLFRDAPMPDAVLEPMADMFHRLGLNTVAVRSSATAEDLPGASFAGQQDSYLNITGLPDVVRAVIRCWGSLWTDRVMQYRLNNGFAADEVAMGVVVQALIPADTAGVLFSANPVTGARDQVMINSSWGLGEAVVSGLVTPDTFVIDKDTGLISDRRIGKKTVMTVRTGAGTKEIPVDEARQDMASVTEDQITALTRLACDVEAYEGHPMDMEWAFHEGELFLLQARPITALPEPLDEVDAQGYEWSRLMLIERYPDPLTPYTASTMSSTFFQSFDRTFRMMGGSLPEGAKMVGHFYGRPYLNATLLASAGFGTSTEISSSQTAGKKRKRPGLVSLAKIARVLLTAQKEWHRLQEPFEQFAARENAREWAAEDLPGLMAATEGHENRVYPLLSNHADSIIAAELTLQMLRFLTRSWLEDEDGLLATGFLSGLTGNVTVRTNHDLWRLARSAAAHDELRDYLSKPIPAGGDWRARIGGVQGGEAFLAGFGAFLKTYGHRSPKYEFRHPNWLEAPEQVLEMIRLYMDKGTADPAEGEAKQARAREAAEAQARRALSLPKRMVFNRVLKLTQTYFRLRENQQFYLMMMAPAQKAILAATAQKLVAAGVLDTPDDIFFLEQEEGQALARMLSEAGAVDPDTCNRIRAQVAAGRADLERFARMDTPVHLGGPEPQSTRQNDGMTGVAASKGIVTGPVRVILNPDGFGTLQPGEILVTPATTPAWTPLFGVAGGLITDFGGLLSHSGVVAREYGLPAVLGVGNATKVLKTGEMVRIDGTLGTIERVAEG